jgi:hypothetical protein
VVNISVQGKIREDNPLYHDPFFREFFRFFRWRRKSLSKNSDNLACAPFRTGLQYSALKSVACARDKLRLALKFDGSNSGPETSCAGAMICAQKTEGRTLAEFRSPPASRFQSPIGNAKISQMPTAIENRPADVATTVKIRSSETGASFPMFTSRFYLPRERGRPSNLVQAVI